MDLLESRLSLRHSADPEIEPLSDFSLRLRAMAEHVKETQGALQKNYGRRSGRDPDEVLDHLVVLLVPIAKAAGISPTAHYSDAKGKRSGRFVALLREVLRLATGKPVYGSGPAERAARVLKSLKQKRQVKIRLKSGQF